MCALLSECVAELMGGAVFELWMGAEQNYRCRLYDELSETLYVCAGDRAGGLHCSCL